jgi:U3 small nucleolar RNA-associated protein 25
MSGNVDDCFRLGISMAKKCLKLYVPFDDADILVCSPLGLRMIIGGEGDKKREYDFLASIEVLVLDMVFYTYIYI